MWAEEKKGHTIAKFKSQFCALLVFLIGITVLVGWYSHLPALIQVHSSFVPMQYNTALGFLLSGIAVFSLQHQFKPIAQICAAVVLTIGLFTLSECVFSVNLGIDQLLMEHYITVKTSHPGRMAPNTALCFTLTGLNVLTYLFLHSQLRYAVNAILPATIFALGTLALFGYFSEIEPLFGWGKLTQMAVHTSIGFMLIGVSLLCLVWFESQQKNLPLFKWLPFSIGTVLVLATLLVWQAITINELNKQRDMLKIEANYIAANLESTFQSLYRALHRKAERLVVNSDTQSAWHHDAQEYFLDFSYLVFLKLRTPNFTLGANTSNWQPMYFAIAPKLDITPNSFVRADNSALGIAAPLLFKKGHYVGWLAIQSKQHDSLLLALVDYKDLVENSLKTVNLLNRFELNIHINQQEVYRSQSYDNANGSNLTQTVQLALEKHMIIVDVQPLAASIAYWVSELPKFILVFGTLITILTVWLMQLLRSLTQKHQLLAFNQKLKKEIEQKQSVQTALLVSNNKLRISNRDLEQFAFIASHDLKEPLRKVQAFGNLLLEEYHDKIDEEGQYYIHTMQSAAQRMSQLITDLLAFSRITTTGKQPRPCELSEIVNDILEDLAIPIEEYQVNILVHKLPKVRVDASQLAIVFQNLISNAIKFREPSRPLEIEISAEQIPDCWLIHVADNGIGFNEQFTEKIFQIFQRLHNKQKIPGTGIGLAICRRIMERHGGNIIVESKPNKGSKFTLKLPERIFDEENNNELQAD